MLWLDSRYFSESYWWDRSKYNNDGVVYGAKFKENGFYFDGVDDYVDCGDSDSLNVGLAGSEGMTIEALIKPGSTPITDAVIVNSNGFRYALTYHNATNLYFYINSGSNGLAYGMSYNIKHHVIGTWDGTTNENGMKLYVDGVLVRERTSSYDSTNATGPVYVGGTNTFDGIIYFLRIYKRYFTPDEVKILARNAGF